MITREQRIQGLRQMADWLEAHPEIPLDTWSSNILSTYVEGKDELLALMDAAEGPWVKNYMGSYLEVKREFPGITYEINIERELVCTKRVVGTTTEMKRDPELLRLVPEVPVEVDVVEWECHPLLAPTDAD